MLPEFSALELAPLVVVALPVAVSPPELVPLGDCDWLLPLFPPRVRLRLRFLEPPEPPEPPVLLEPREPPEPVDLPPERLPVSPKSSTCSASRPARTWDDYGSRPVVPAGIPRPVYT